MAATSTSETLSGLARILSNEPLPQLPNFRSGDDAHKYAKEIESYTRNLHVYLKRLFGHFTATNIITTINNNGGVGGFTKTFNVNYHYEGTNDISIVIDSTTDWRNYAFFNYGRMASSYAGLTTGGASSTDDDNAEFPCDSSDMMVMSAGGVDARVHVDTGTGVLTLDIQVSGVHAEAFITLSLFAFNKVPAEASFTSKGNGL